MTPNERVIASCEHRSADRVPVYHASISSRTASVVLGREAYVGGGIQQWREAVSLWNGEQAHREFLERTRRDALELPEVLDTDLVRPWYWRLNEKPARRIGEFTFLYGDPGKSWRVMRFDPDTELYQTVDRHPKVEPTEMDLEAEVARREEKLDRYDPKAELLYQDVVEALKVHQGKRAVPGLAVGIAVPNRSQAWIEMVAANPGLVKRLIDIQTEYVLRRIDSYAPLSVHVMLGGGDMATNHGPIYSPKAFREIMVPNLKRLVEACRAVGKYYFFASDGNLWPIADDLFPIVDGYYEIDRRAGMDLKLLRERYPHLTLIGNISSHTLHRGTKQEVVEETLSCIEAAKEYGSIIVGVSNLIVPQTPKENLLAMLETLSQER